MSWIDEECGIYSACQMKSHLIVTKLISEMNFLSPAFQGDVIEIGVETISIGRTSLTVACSVRNKETRKDIIRVERLVFVNVDESGKPLRHALAGLAGQSLPVAQAETLAS